MIKKAGIMFVNKDSYAEYEKRHNELWPEMASAIKNHGGSNYSIFLDEPTGKLFAYLEIENEEKWSALASTDICKKWWLHMKDIMETNEDNSPVYIDLKSVFYLA